MSVDRITQAKATVQRICEQDAKKQHAIWGDKCFNKTFTVQTPHGSAQYKIDKKG